MSMDANTSSPFPYIDPSLNVVHRGIVAVTGSLEVDLGIGHNNFVVQPCIKGSITDLAPGDIIAWDYGSKPGSFIIQVGKYNAGSWIAATAAVNVSFVAVADASV